MEFLSAIRSLGIVSGILFFAISSAFAEAPPRQIYFWHGEEQIFGQPAQTQKFVNILGNVSEPETIARLSYSLNGADSRLLSIGPDKRRLEEAGDFNIDIPTSDLREGTNEVTLVATDGKGSEASRTLTFEYRPARIKDREYAIRWNSTEDLQRLGVAVDGRWKKTPEGLWPAILGYDRSFAIGD
jgi:hypothetical protein